MIYILVSRNSVKTEVDLENIHVILKRNKKSQKNPKNSWGANEKQEREDRQKEKAKKHWKKKK